MNSIRNVRQSSLSAGARKIPSFERISVPATYHRTTRPCSSRRGLQWKRNQTHLPSCLCKRGHSAHHERRNRVDTPQTQRPAEWLVSASILGNHTPILAPRLEPASQVRGESHCSLERRELLHRYKQARHRSQSLANIAVHQEAQRIEPALLPAD